MHAKDLVVDNAGAREAVKAIPKCPPKLDGVPPLALIVESVYAVNARAFMVPSQEEKIFGVLHLIAKHEANCLDALVRAVNIIPEKQVVRLRWETAHLEQPEEVIILPMRVATNVYGSCHFQEHRLRQ